MSPRGLLIDTKASPIHFFAGDADASNVNWTIASGLGQASTHYFGIYRQSTNAQNAEITMDIQMSAGTYTLVLYGFRDTDRGIMTITRNGEAVGTIDCYAASSTIQRDASLAGIVVPSSGVHSWRVLMATKNASASAYRGVFNCFSWIRTA